MSYYNKPKAEGLSFSQPKKYNTTPPQETIELTNYNSRSNEFRLVL